MKKKNLFLCPIAASFVDNDHSILSKIFDVKKIIINKKSKVTFIFNVINSIIFSFSCDNIFTWFAAPQFFPCILFSRLMNKKIIVIAGGYDAAYAKFDDYCYGVRCNKLKKLVTSFIFNNADLVLAVSEYTKKEVLEFCKPKRIEVVYNGININKFTNTKKLKKKDIVITVASNIETQYYKKGLETFIQTALRLPEIEFILIGKYNKQSKKMKEIFENKPKNLKIINFIPQEELITLYSETKVYAQLSLHESFGCALAEAMLCECVPVIANTSALPEVVGDTGFYVRYGDVEDTAGKIKKALKSKNGEKVRQRIINRFSLIKREKKLTLILNELLR